MLQIFLLNTAMVSLRTACNLEGNSKTKNCGLGLNDIWPPQPWPRRPL